MAGSTKAKEIYVDFGSRLQGFERGAYAFNKGMEDAEKRSNRIAGKITQNLNSTSDSMLRFAAGGVALGAGLVMLAKGAADEVEQLDNMAAKTGLTVQQLQELKVASDAAGIGFDAIAKGIAMAQAKMGGVDDGTGKAADALAELGFSAQDALRPMAELFPQIVARLQGVANEANRAQMAAAIFGKGWQEIAPLLAMSREEMDKLIASARDSGAIMDDTTLQRARELDAEFDKLGMTMKGMRNEALAAIIPLVKDGLLPAFQALLPTVEAFAKFLAGLSPEEVQFAANTILVATAATGLLGVIGKVSAAMMLLNVGKYAAGFKSLAAVLMETTAKKAVDTAVTGANTVAVGANTAALGANATAATGAAAARVVLTGAAAVGAWGLVTAAVAALGAEIYGIWYYTKKANEEQEKGKKLDAENLPKIAENNRRAQERATKARAMGYASMTALQAKVREGDKKALADYEKLWSGETKLTKAVKERAAAAAAAANSTPATAPEVTPADLSGVTRAQIVGDLELQTLAAQDELNDLRADLQATTDEHERNRIAANIRVKQVEMAGIAAVGALRLAQAAALSAAEAQWAQKTALARGTADENALKERIRLQQEELRQAQDAELARAEYAAKRKVEIERRAVDQILKQQEKVQKAMEQSNAAALDQLELIYGNRDVRKGAEIALRLAGGGGSAPGAATVPVLSAATPPMPSLRAVPLSAADYAGIGRDVAGEAVRHVVQLLLPPGVIAATKNLVVGTVRMELKEQSREVAW